VEPPQSHRPKCDRLKSFCSGSFLTARHFLPSHAIGILSLIVLAVAIFGRYARSLDGGWLRAYEKVRSGHSRSAAPEDSTPVKCRRIVQRFWGRSGRASRGGRQAQRTPEQARQNRLLRSHAGQHRPRFGVRIEPFVAIKGECRPRGRLPFASPTRPNYRGARSHCINRSPSQLGPPRSGRLARCALAQQKSHPRRP